MARALATAFAAPLVASTVSRLLVDLNRSVGHPRLHSEATRKAPAEMRERILTLYYQPYRAQAERFVRQAIAEHNAGDPLSSHSFTPELDGEVRDADIGLLYDPARPGEADLCERWKSSLEDLCARSHGPPQLSVCGKRRWPDHLVSSALPPGAYVGIELEVNQKHVVGAGRHWTAMRKVIVESLLQGARQPQRGDCHSRLYNKPRPQPWPVSRGVRP